MMTDKNMNQQSQTFLKQLKVLKFEIWKYETATLTTILTYGIKGDTSDQGMQLYILVVFTADSQYILKVGGHNPVLVDVLLPVNVHTQTAMLTQECMLKEN